MTARTPPAKFFAGKTTAKPSPEVERFAILKELDAAILAIVVDAASFVDEASNRGETDRRLVKLGSLVLTQSRILAMDTAAFSLWLADGRPPLVDDVRLAHWLASQRSEAEADGT